MFRLRSRSSSQVDPLVARVGAFALFQEMPVAALVVDATGAIVQRNRAADALSARVAGERGAAVLVALRDELVKIVRDKPAYPHSRMLRVDADGRRAVVEAVVNRLGDGYVVVWSDVTSASDTARATQSVASELSTSSVSLSLLGDQIAAGTNEVSNRAASVAAGSEQMSASIREIAMSAAAAASGTSTAVGAASLANERLAKLGESSTRIGTVSKLITAIADQTNLLALNATIEAARAGEAGKGFAVVAGEVKELAGRTRTATAEIGEMIAVIQADSIDAATAIGDILRLIEGIEAQQSTVASAVEEQTAVASEMSAGVAALADSATVSANAVDELRSSADFVSSKSIQLSALYAG